jgi:multidrug efflux pump subunit AcrB
VISRFFIDRPIFASVLSAFIVISCLAALRVLPVSQYPDILPPEGWLSWLAIAQCPGAVRSTRRRGSTA